MNTWLQALRRDEIVVFVVQFNAFVSGDQMSFFNWLEFDSWSLDFRIFFFTERMPLGIAVELNI
jgi:hypothetical protein